MSVITVNYY